MLDSDVAHLQPSTTPPFTAGAELELQALQGYRGVIFEVIEPRLDHFRDPFVVSGNFISNRLANPETGRYTATGDGLMPEHHTDATLIPGVGAIRTDKNGAVLAVLQGGRIVQEREKVRVLFVPRTLSAQE